MNARKSQAKSAVLVVLSIAAVLSACTDEATVLADRNRASSAAVTTTADSLYPMVFALDADMLAGADAARKQSKAYDAQCAAMPIAAELHSKRPNGTGCPRPDMGAVQQ